MHLYTTNANIAVANTYLYEPLDAPSLSLTADIFKLYIPISSPPGRVHRPPPPPPPSLIIEKACYKSEQTMLSDKQLLICVPFIRDYSFENHKWGMLFLLHRYKKMRLICSSPFDYQLSSPCPMDRGSIQEFYTSYRGENHTP